MRDKSDSWLARCLCRLLRFVVAAHNMKSNISTDKVTNHNQSDLTKTIQMLGRAQYIGATMVTRSAILLQIIAIIVSLFAVYDIIFFETPQLIISANYHGGDIAGFSHTAEFNQTVPPEIAINTSSCLWIHHTNYGRSGNRIIQIKEIDTILSHCSGVATSSSDTNKDPAVAFSPITLATRGPLAVDSLLEVAARSCREVTYEWGAVAKLVQGCSATPAYRIHRQSTGRNDGTGVLSDVLFNVFTDMKIWKLYPFADMMVMYFRGGDVLSPDADYRYFQGPCSLFLEAWNYVNASRLMLVFDPEADINPCVDVVRNKVPASTIIPTPCDSVGCHLTLVGLAPYLVISGFTTFANQAIALFPNRRRIIFEYFCSHPPAYDGTSTKVCAKGNTTAFSPWTYTDTTRSQMLSTPSELVLGDFTRASMHEYLNRTTQT